MALVAWRMKLAHKDIWLIMFVKMFFKTSVDEPKNNKSFSGSVRKQHYTMFDFMISKLKSKAGNI